MHLSARIYGAVFAAAAPLRIVWANLINRQATLEAFELFVKARIERAFAGVGGRRSTLIRRMACRVDGRD